LTPDEVMNIREDELLVKMNIREDELLVKMPQQPAARLTQRRYYDEPESRDRALARGESWIPPLGPIRADGPLEPPEFDDALDDEEPATPDDDEQDWGTDPFVGAGDGDEPAALAAVEHDDGDDPRGAALPIIDH